MNVKTMQNVKAILAVDSTNGLAKNGKIPWKSKTDMSFFKNATLQNTVVMGSNTLLSLPNEHPLPDRNNIVITSQKQKYNEIYKAFNNLVFLDLDETIEFMKNNETTTFFIIGGNQIYDLLLPYCSTIFLTKIKKSYDCDLIFKHNFLLSNKELLYEDDELEIYKFV